MLRAPLALICAALLEAEPVRSLLNAVAPLTIGRKPASAGTLQGVPVLLFPAGMGKTNAAQGLTALLESHTVRGVIGFGVAGAYPGSELELGDVALASEEIYGDEGVEAPGGWLSTEHIGIPLLEARGVPHFNRFPLDESRVAAARRALRDAGVAAAVGPFLTVSACSGTTARGRQLAERFGALCESMEGAALAHVCALYEVPLLELRGVSNAVEDRDLSRWRLRDAAHAAANGVQVLVTQWDTVMREV